MDFESLLPMMEAVYNRRKVDSYKITQSNDERGICVVAAQAIEGGALVLVEKALHVQSTNNDHPSLINTPEYQSLMKTTGKNNEAQDTKSSEVCASSSDVKSQLYELNATAYVYGSGYPKRQQEEIWQLEDSHRQARIGNMVMIDGLASEAGRKLNGARGYVLKQDETDSSRLGVEIIRKAGKRQTDDKVVRSIKPCNLKTLGGIMRTNAYQNSDGTEDQDASLCLFQKMCRVNHACGEAANVYRIVQHGKAYVSAKRDIAAGEELFLDYLPNYEKGDRLEAIQNLFNFRCKCAAH